MFDCARDVLPLVSDAADDTTSVWTLNTADSVRVEAASRPDTTKRADMVRLNQPGPVGRLGYVAAIGGMLPSPVNSE